MGFGGASLHQLPYTDSIEAYNVLLIQERRDIFKPFQVFPCKEKKTCKVSVKSDNELAVQHSFKK